jgi:hypothetical protein
MNRDSVARSARFMATLILCMLASVKCFAQYDSTLFASHLLSQKIHELEARHVDTIVCYHTDCGDCFIRKGKGKDTCNLAYARYLFWREKGKSFACRFDYCGEHKVIRIAKDSFAVITSVCSQIIKLRPRDGTVGTVGNGLDSALYFNAADGTPVSFFEFYLKNRRIEIDIDSWVFQSKITGLNPSMLKLLKTLWDTAFNEVRKYDKWNSK